LTLSRSGIMMLPRCAPPTLTLDPDVARLIEEEVHRARKPFKQVVNDALRRALSPHRPAIRRRAYRVEAHAARFLPGLDRARLNALADELDDSAILEKLSRSGVAG
jgi:hypothetical protein